jgi:hypothetical protein
MNEQEIKEMLGVKPERTLKQNKAIHLAYRLLADSLNGAGLDQRKVLKPSIQIPWTDRAVKEMLYRPIMQAMFQVKSTTELDTKQISEVWEVLTRELSKTCGEAAYIPFPDETQLENYLKSFKQ